MMGRITYIDTAKFLAIYFVIVSHCSMGSHISNFLFSFHVPLFFILYGYVHRAEDNITIWSWIRTVWGGGLLHRILIPYFLLAFILGEHLSVKSFCLVAYGSIQSLTGITSTHLWFLPCYFISVLLYNIVEILLKEHKIFFFTIILLLAFISSKFNSNADIIIYIRDYLVHLTGYGIIGEKHYCLGFPFAINVAFSGCLFILLGNILSTLLTKLTYIKKVSFKIITFIISIFVGTYCYVANDGDNQLIAMSLAKYGNYFYFVITASCFSLATILLAMGIDNALFAKYGKHTMAIYGFHLSLTFIPVIICRIIRFDFEQTFELKGLFFGSIILIVSCMLIPIIRKIDSNLIGERN